MTLYNGKDIDEPTFMTIFWPKNAETYGVLEMIF